VLKTRSQKTRSFPVTTTKADWGFRAVTAPTRATRFGAGSSGELLGAGPGTSDPELTVMADETRLERRFEGVLERVKTVRGAAVVIAATSTSITLGAGLLMTVADHHNFPSIGSGLWWAIQTVTTVGYGDHVPATVAGRLIAALVMLAGIGFLTVITAAITSSFVSRSPIEQTTSSGDAPTAEQFRQMDERLERIEAALTGRP
jgi:voltage-gated potassium channel